MGILRRQSEARRDRRSSLPRTKVQDSQSVRRINIRLEREYEADQLAERLNQMSALYGRLKTDSEIRFIKILTEHGACSLRLLLIYTFTLWYLSIVPIHFATFGVDFLDKVRCEVPALEGHFNFYEILNMTVNNNSQSCGVYCFYEDRDYVNLVKQTNYNYKLIMEIIRKENVQPRQVVCNKYVGIDDISYGVLAGVLKKDDSIREEFQFFCTNKRWYAATEMADVFARIIACVTFGVAADLYGRKPTFFGSSLLCVISFLLMLYPSKYIMVLGTFLSGVGTISNALLYIIVLEKCSDSIFIWMGFFIFLVNPFSELLAFLLSYFIRRWRYLHLANTCMFLVLPYGIWYMAESPRWCLFTSGTERAWEALKDYGVNTELHADVYLDVVNEREVVEPSLNNITNFFLKPVYKKRLIICAFCYCMYSISIVIYAIMENKEFNVGKADFYVLLSGLQIIASLICFPVSICIGRRKTLFFLSLILSVLDLTIFLLKPTGLAVWVLPTLMFVHLALVQNTLCLLYFYTAEMFPTAYRATAIGFCLTAFGVGQIIQQELAQLVENSSRLVMFAPPLIASVVCALAVVFLPTTTNKGLADTPREALHMPI